jgi:hypothetical protein
MRSAAATNDRSPAPTSTLDLQAGSPRITAYLASGPARHELASGGHLTVRAVPEFSGYLLDLLSKSAFALTMTFLVVDMLGGDVGVSPKPGVRQRVHDCRDD